MSTITIAGTKPDSKAPRTADWTDGVLPCQVTAAIRMSAPLTYHPLERLHIPRPVDRYDYVRERCRGLRVLDLGAYDETEVDRDQHASWRWLHGEIAAAAKTVLGVDASDRVRTAGEVTTSVGSRIVYGRAEDVAAIAREFAPDLVVAGELIEHTPDPLAWLSELARARPATALLLTTPNATAIVNLVLAFAHRESCHPDHLQVYSYKTLMTLAARIPLHAIEVRPYYYAAHIFKGRLPRPLAPLVTLADRALLRPIQYLFPLTAFGWIVEGRLGEP